MDYTLSEHAQGMLNERKIREDWVKLALEDPHKKESREDGTVHYLRPIEQCGGRYIRVVVNPNVTPQKVVTVFFDRRIRNLP
ncbi:MAG: DUF4258 domain-containing protein [Bacteroidetes bacterium]|nr:DUF4258 domain-containing protein [Bacteroidota bacterium]